MGNNSKIVSLRWKNEDDKLWGKGSPVRVKINAFVKQALCQTRDKEKNKTEMKRIVMIHKYDIIQNKTIVSKLEK